MEVGETRFFQMVTDNVIASKKIAADTLQGDFTTDATTGGGPGGLPPGAIFLDVFEGCGTSR